jgi:hypothetical protein
MFYLILGAIVLIAVVAIGGNFTQATIVGAIGAASAYGLKKYSKMRP